MCQGGGREFLWPGGQVNRQVKKFSIYWGWEETMYMEPVILMGLEGARSVAFKVII